MTTLNDAETEAVATLAGELPATLTAAAEGSIMKVVMAKRGMLRAFTAGYRFSADQVSQCVSLFQYALRVLTVRVARRVCYRAPARMACGP